MYLNEKVVENRLVGHPGQAIYKMVLKGQAAQTAQPGQFVHIRVAESFDPLLRRPLSIAGINREREEITIYYRVAGKGTRLLSQIRANEYLSVLGPLGTGFTIPRDGEFLLIAGGIGVFPIYSLMEAVAQPQVKIKLFWGGENKEFLESAGLKHLQDLGIDYEITTLDGSLGQQGLVTDPFRKYLAEVSNSFAGVKDKTKTPPLWAAACGPPGMLKAVTEICLENGIPLEVSLEERMACGVGACLGCVCTVRDAAGNLRRKRACKDGPVFEAKEVVWDAGV
ncbi:MAG TPA: dihydroorotate dehydrogenase electron transfer subunit [Peptococcaceae bacterium]|nr:dihydroorotate dehydrogenase electron transfer subunit [Peptococcaceae bacterium]